MQRKNYFRSNAEIIVAGRKYSLSLAEQNALVSRLNYWHGEGNPSTWLAVSTFLAVRHKYPNVAEETVLALAALALGVSRDALVGLIRWHENYMRWHDGDETYQILAPTPDVSADAKE
ncbi:MAG: hypothetical protein CL608_04770 [Anaerolineaceae bacterium]|nr:hypothetical protein [Anaerolineaceae bacterium]